MTFNYVGLLGQHVWEEYLWRVEGAWRKWHTGTSQTMREVRFNWKFIRLEIAPNVKDAETLNLSFEDIG